MKNNIKDLKVNIIYINLYHCTSISFNKIDRGNFNTILL